MTATTVPATAGAPARSVGVGTQFVRLLSSEWTKLRSVRSTMWTLLSTVLLTIGLPCLIGWAVVSDPSGPGPDFRADTFSLFSVFLAQLIVGALGVMVISAEYSTGTIRATLTATPQRLSMLVAKTLTFAVVLAVFAFITTFAAYLAVQPILNTKNLGMALGDGQSVRIVVQCALYLVLVGLLGLGIGAILRHTAAGISTVVALLFVVPILSNFLPQSWQVGWVKYQPGNALNGILIDRPDPHALGSWASLAVFAAWALLALVVGAIFLQRRDA
jgi:ABC-2 type transport system permease protein